MHHRPFSGSGPMSSVAIRTRVMCAVLAGKALKAWIVVVPELSAERNRTQRLQSGTAISNAFTQSTLGIQGHGAASTWRSRTDVTVSGSPAGRLQ